MTRLIRVLICLVGVLAATAPALAAADAPAKSAWERHREAADEAATLDRAECESRGGRWSSESGGGAACELPTADGGRICRKGADCAIACVSRSDPRYSKNPFVIGECLRSTARNGCFFYVEGGRVAHALCRE